MQIIKYKKSRNNQYILLLGNKCQIELYEDTILKYELLIKKEIDSTLFKEILEYNKRLDCYYSAIQFLSFKKRSSYEIKSRLKDIGYDEDDILYTIHLLSEQKYIDDYHYALSFLRDKLLTTLHGPNRIKNDLRKKGIAAIIISDIIQEYTYDIQYEKIHKIIDKMIRSNNNKGGIYLKRKIFNDLCYQGFDRKIIEEIIEMHSFGNDDLIRKKEEEKLRKKYSSKYSDIELEYKIKGALKRKGLLVLD